MDEDIAAPPRPDVALPAWAQARPAPNATGMPAPVRAKLELAFGADFSDVRVHPASTRAAQLGARAFTQGREIHIAPGYWSPETLAGQELLGHELAHVLQQRLGRVRASARIMGMELNDEPALEREADERGARAARAPFASPERLGPDYMPDMAFVGHTVGLGSSRPSRAALQMSPARATRLIITLGAGNAATFTLECDGGRPLTASGTAIHLEPGRYQIVAQADAGRVTVQFVGSPRPGGAAAFEIPAPGAPMLALFRAITAPIPLLVMGGYGSSIEQLPERVRRVLFAATGTRELGPGDEATLLRIGGKLDLLSDDELEAFRARTVGSTGDLAAVEAGVDGFLDEMQRLQRAGAERERTKLRLSRLDAVYDRYREYLSMQSSSSRLTAFGMVSPRALGTAAGMQPTLSRMSEELTAELQRYEFASIDDFAQAIRDFELAFRDETVLIARDMLDRYEHVLEEQQRRYGEAAEANALHQQLTPARQRFQSAARIRDEHAQTPWTLDEMANQAYWAGQAVRERAGGREAVRELSPAHPLLGNRDIPHEQLALADQGGVQSSMLGYIAARRRDVHQTRINLGRTPDLIFELPELRRISCARQGIAPGSLHHRIITDRVHDDALDQAAINLAIAVLAIAAGLVSGGGGAVAVLGATTMVGVGAYQAFEEFRHYEQLHAAHGAQLTSTDPSFAWVVVALVGIGLDAAAAGRVLVPELRQALNAFNRANDVAGALTTLDTELAELVRLSIIEARIHQSVIRAARLEAEARTAWRSAFRPPAALRAVLVPGVEEFSRLVYAVYLSARRGVAQFDLFVRTHEAVDLIGDVARLSPEDLTRLKTAYTAAVRDAEDIARHGQGLGLTESEIADVMQQWSQRSGVTADTVKQEMTASRAAQTTGAPTEHAPTPSTSGPSPGATVGLGGRILSAAEQAAFDAFAARARALGWIENPHRTGSWGRLVGGRFQELGRIDVAEAGKPGWRGRTHIHITGQSGHLDPTTRLPGE